MKGFNIKRFFAGVIFNFFVFAFLIASAVNSIPERVYVSAGEGMALSFDVPLTISFDEAVGVISVTNSEGEKRSRLDLNEPLYVNAPETGNVSAEVSLLGIPIKTVDISVISEKKVVPSGNIVGVTMDTKGILVLGTGEVTNFEGKKTDPAKGKVIPGDIILEVNGETIDDKEALAQTVSAYEGGSFNITLMRNGKRIDVSLKPIESEDGNKLGLWVRDSTQGLGTVTYFDAADNRFAALGHGIYDVDTSTLMEVKKGSITKAEVTGINKGEKGSPGEVMGSLDKTRTFGTILKNTNMGLFGTVNYRGEDYFGEETLPIGMRYEVKEGRAYIKSDILGGKAELFEVNIDSIDRYGGNSNKSMVLTVTDARLLNKTGGIIQGMSGSPIIQNGKIIGAVTHVLVNDPARGYGIFIENMLDAAG